MGLNSRAADYVTENKILSMEAFDFTNNQLKELLKQLKLNVSGTKTELVARLDAALTQEKRLAIMQRKIAEGT